MATQTLANADAILKDLYVGPIVEQLNYKTYMLDQIERDSDHIDHTGRRAIVPLHTTRNRGRGSRGSNSNMPVAGRQGWQDAIIPIRYHYYAIEVDDPAIEASKTNEGAFINVLDAETQGVSKEMKKDVNRQIFGTGDGLLSPVRAVTGGAGFIIPVDNNIQYIGIGDVVDVVVQATGATTNGVLNATVTGRDLTAGAQTITVDTTTAGALSTAYGVYLNGSRNLEMDGLRNVTGTSRTLHSINSATVGNEFWNGQTISAGSATATESLFEQLDDNVGAGGNGEVEVFLSTRGIKRRLADTYQSQKRYNDAKAVDIHGGYTAIMVNEKPVIADDDAPKGFAFAINKSAFKWFQQAGPGWMQQGGSAPGGPGGIFHLKDGTTTGTKMNVWQAWFKWYAALGTVAPNRTGRITAAADDNAT